MMTCKHYFGIIFMKDINTIFKRGDENHCKYLHKWMIHFFIGEREYELVVWKKLSDKNPYGDY